MTVKQEEDMMLISKMSSSSCLSEDADADADADGPHDDLNLQDVDLKVQDSQEEGSSQSTTCTSTSVTMTPESNFFVSSDNHLLESPPTMESKENDHNGDNNDNGAPLRGILRVPLVREYESFATMNGKEETERPYQDHDDDSPRRDKPRSPSVGEYGQIEHLDDDEQQAEQQQQDPLLSNNLAASNSSHSNNSSQKHLEEQHHHFHLLRQIREDAISDGSEEDVISISSGSQEKRLPLLPTGLAPLKKKSTPQQLQDKNHFDPFYSTTNLVYWISKRCFMQEDFCHATWIGFWALLMVTCANYVLTPMRDAVALQVGVQHMPKLTLMSSGMAFLSSVPIGWLFEAPDPQRRNVWKKMGFSRGETQGTSLALFYRCFALSLLFYAVGFVLVDWWHTEERTSASIVDEKNQSDADLFITYLWSWIPYLFSQLGHVMYIAFFLVVHLMKLHSLSLVWGVTTEAMEYEDVARKTHHTANNITLPPKKTRTRLQRLSLVGFGGTLGGILGRYVGYSGQVQDEDCISVGYLTHPFSCLYIMYYSMVASSLANILHMSGLLVVAAILLEVSAQLSIELGRIMQRHWEQQQLFKSTNDLASLDSSMKRSSSLGSMKRVASGNSLMKRVASSNSMSTSSSAKSLADLAGAGGEGDSFQHSKSTNDLTHNNTAAPAPLTGTIPPPYELHVDKDTFTQRLLRGITTILQSRLLMAIFTYNALYASTSVLLSFQRAALVANRNSETTVSADTAFLANINMASSVAVFAMQASGVGALVAQKCGSRGSLSLMPLIRLAGVLSLAWWHKFSGGQAPNLIIFLMLDECTRVVNLAIAKPVRESLWRGLSNEARYEAKPIVDTLANRWGAGSSAFCVSMVQKAMLWAGITAATAEPSIFGFPPVLFLCLIVAAWWTIVSADLGHIRQKIDMELKKHQ
jgi:hypothetical protein